MEKIKKLFKNRYIIGGASVAWVVLLLPYYAVVGTITGIGYVYAVLHDYLLTVFGKRSKANMLHVFTDTTDELDECWDVIDSNLI